MGYYTTKKIKKTTPAEGETHAIDIFKSRLLVRGKKEENSFVITEIKNKKNETIGTKIEFCLKTQNN